MLRSARRYGGWQTELIVGKASTWRYEDRGGIGGKLLIHSNIKNVIDAYIVVTKRRDAPDGVKKIDEGRAEQGPSRNGGAVFLLERSWKTSNLLSSNDIWSGQLDLNR